MEYLICKVFDTINFNLVLNLNKHMTTRNYNCKNMQSPHKSANKL